VKVNVDIRIRNTESDDDPLIMDADMNAISGSEFVGRM
jgi:hypothetical protein